MGRQARTGIPERVMIERGYEYVRAQVVVPDADTYGAHGDADPEVVAAIRQRDVPWRPRP